MLPPTIQVNAITTQKNELFVCQNPLWDQKNAYGTGSSTVFRYLFNNPTFLLNETLDEERRRVWQTQIRSTLYSSCSKVARCPREEPTVRGEESTKSFVPSCKITISEPNSLMTLKSYFKTLAIVRPPTPCHLQMKSGVVMLNFLVYWWSREWTITSWRRRIKEWPKIRTRAFPIAKVKRQNLNPTQQVNKRTKKGKRELLYLPKKPESSVELGVAVEWRGGRN